ncbi:hypothetical protein JJB98_29760 [Bradyrhizobium diazoefficiens]|nr:hypothetical protein [Bradyrhizobium diazoefficiens]QQO23774.1 hypothetical protein JJB98_29760 [Bradyrhizobium diazoefficiens]
MAPRGLLTVWRRQVAAMAVKVPSFVPIQIGAESSGTADERIASAQMRSLETSAPPIKSCGVIEIELSGARIRIEPGVELATFSTVLSALRGIR